MDVAYAPYIIMEVFCIIYSAAILFRLRKGINLEKETVVLKKTIYAYIVMVMSDIFAILLKGQTLQPLYFLNAFSNGISITSVVFGCFYWYQFVEIRLGSSQAIREKIGHWDRLPAIIAIVLDMASIFTGWVFAIDSNGLYILSNLFWVQELVTYVYILIPTVHAIYMVIVTTSPQKRKEYLTYVEYICIPCFIVVIEDYFKTIPLFSLSIFTIILILFLTLYLDQEYELAMREKELTDSRMAVMLSQIQPHFLYNALAVIQDMCTDKAPEAAQTTVEFAEYLRGNLDSLNQSVPVPFKRELQHTKTYLTLESKRFGDYLRVVYDIQATGFFIPSITLQPIVENAVKHGIMKREDGGCVRIASVENENNFTVTVTDNGIGFDINAKPDDDRTHIGLSNVRSRLATMCGGTLSIESTPGVGTSAVITLPKDRESRMANENK